MIRDFEYKWATYKSHVLSIAYPTSFPLDKSLGFSDILNEFENVNNFKIAKTVHHANLEMFHVMINLSAP
jgi:hypothetical protein